MAKFVSKVVFVFLVNGNNGKHKEKQLANIRLINTTWQMLEYE